MRLFISKIKWMLLYAAIAAFLAFMFVNEIIMTVSYMIIGLFIEEVSNETWVVIFPYIIIMSSYYVLFGWIPWRFHAIRMEEGKREYLNQLGGDAFDRQKTIESRKTNKSFKTELVAYAVCIVVELIVLILKVDITVLIAAPIMAPIMFAVFWLCNRKLYVDLRETWAAERIRLNPDTEGKQ